MYFNIVVTVKIILLQISRNNKKQFDVCVINVSFDFCYTKKYRTKFAETAINKAK